MTLTRLFKVTDALSVLFVQSTSKNIYKRFVNFIEFENKTPLFIDKLQGS